MDKQKIAIVVPVHITPSKEWIKSLESVAKGHTVIIVDDSNGKVELPGSWDVYGYDRQRQELGEELYKQFEQFHKSSACRNFGHWIAYKQKFDIIIGLDSDCIVGPSFISQHLENLDKASSGWDNPIARTNWFPRGYPYRERVLPTVVSMGLWSNELDVNGADRVLLGNPPKDPSVDIQRSSVGFIPLCGMNFAIRRELVPGFLFLPNIDYKYGDNDTIFKFRRHDDIWGGYILQKFMKLRKEGLIYGNPIVHHDTIIDAKKDAEEEVAMNTWEGDFYDLIDNIFQDIDWGMYADMFNNFWFKADKIFMETPFENFIDSLNFWAKLFNEDLSEEE